MTPEQRASLDERRAALALVAAVADEDRDATWAIVGDRRLAALVAVWLADAIGRVMRDYGQDPAEVVRARLARLIAAEAEADP